MRAIAWTLAGTLSAAIGLIGLLLPILPGFIFLILAVWCFANAGRHSDKGPSAHASRLEARLARLSQSMQLRFWLLARRLLPDRGRSGNRRAGG